MGILFRPDQQLISIEDFPFDEMAREGIRLLFSDVDNTLTRWNDPAVPAQALAFAARLRSKQIDLCLVSNNNEKRIQPIAQRLGATYVAKARKPLPFALSSTMRRRGLPKTRCALIGDQLLTDVLAGNVAGMRTFLVKPLDLSHEYRGTRINRRIEAVLFKLLALDGWDT